MAASRTRGAFAPESPGKSLPINYHRPRALSIESQYGSGHPSCPHHPSPWEEGVRRHGWAVEGTGEYGSCVEPSRVRCRPTPDGPVSD